MARSTGGTSTYPWAAPPSRVVRTEEALGLFRAEKGAFHDLVTSSCTSGKKGTGGGCRRSACAPRNQSSSLERSGRRRTPIVQPDALSSPGKHSGQFWIWLGQRYSSWRRAAQPNRPPPEPSSSPDAVIDNLSSAGAPNEMLGPALSEDPAYSSGNPRRCDVLEEWEARGGVLDGEALTVILRSPWPWAEVVLRPEELERGRARGIPPRLARRYLERNIAMGHVPAVRTWLIHERCLSVLKAQARGAAIVDHQMKSGNDHIQKRTSGKPSLKRRPSLVELF